MPLGYKEPPEKREARHTNRPDQSWQAPPGSLGLKQAHEREANLEESGFLKLMERATRESRESRFTDREEQIAAFKVQATQH